MTSPKIMLLHWEMMRFNFYLDAAKKNFIYKECLWGGKKLNKSGK